MDCRKIEDLEFTLEEETINKSDVEVKVNCKQFGKDIFHFFEKSVFMYIWPGKTKPFI